MVYILSELLYQEKKDKLLTVPKSLDSDHIRALTSVS